MAWSAARAAGGKVILRVEDIDRDRCSQDLEAEQLRDLEWLGLDWDVGPIRQSDRIEMYQDALGRLDELGAVFPCVCSRREIQLAASAPHEGDEQFYPGTCRGRFADADQAMRETGRVAAWRFRTSPGKISFVDRVFGEVSTDTHELVGDFVVMRRDGWPAYQLAVVVDDIEMGVTQVVRGSDLLTSTARQILLRERLGYTGEVDWAHLPLAVDSDGNRLAKRRDSLSLRSIRQSGIEAEALVGVLGHSLGLVAAPLPMSAAELVERFRWNEIPKTPWRVELPWADETARC